MNVDHVCRTSEFFFELAFKLSKDAYAAISRGQIFSEFKNAKQINAQWIRAQNVCTMWWCATSIGMLKQRIHFHLNSVYVWSFCLKIITTQSINSNRTKKNQNKKQKLCRIKRFVQICERKKNEQYWELQNEASVIINLIQLTKALHSVQKIQNWLHREQEKESQKRENNYYYNRIVT